MKTGIANLPLHSGRAPGWLFNKMKRLAREIVLAVVYEKGNRELIRKLSDPFWFQAFGCVLGFDWHSSGLTTTVCGALKEGLRSVSSEIGVYVAGGKGKTAIKTPEDIRKYCNKTGQNADELIYASRMSAKVDNTAIQDNYSLYHHTFIFLKGGSWTVIQQGMNPDVKMGRRYHWLSEKLENYVCEPHSAVCCDKKHKNVLNLVDRNSKSARKVCSDIPKQKISKVIKQFKGLRKLDLPKHHYVKVRDFSIKRLEKNLNLAYGRENDGFESLLLVKGVGAKTIRALSLLSELIYKTPVSIKDPTRFSFAHGGKDGYPYPVDEKVYNESIDFLHKAVKSAKLGRTDKIKALNRLEKRYY